MRLSAAITVIRAVTTASVDVRARHPGVADPVEPAAFWAGPWAEGMARNGSRAAEDAALLELEPLTIRVDGDPWTLAGGDDGIEVRPGGGTAQKPVGTVAIAVSSNEGAKVRTLNFVGPRTQVKFWSTQAALDMVRRLLIRR